MLRRVAAGWEISGRRGCVVPDARVQRALDSLSTLQATPTKERPSSFELQVAAFVNEERVLQFDVGPRNGKQDLVELIDGTSYVLEGLDRELLSPSPASWCASL